MSKAYKLQVKVELWSSKASCSNIDLEKQTDVKGCMVCISIYYFLSYKLHSARGKFSVWGCYVSESRERNVKGQTARNSLSTQAKFCMDFWSGKDKTRRPSNPRTLLQELLNLKFLRLPKLEI